MSSSVRYAAVAAFISSVAGYAVGVVPEPTIPGYGDNFSPAPTKAPVMELVRAKLAKKEATNICGEWTISGGHAQPQCFNSETCLFTSASGYYYEGCGRSGVKYNWITECYDYKGQSASAPISQTYCPSSAPKCGFWAFVFSPGYTNYNFGCSTSSYAIYVNTLPSNGTTSSPSSTDTATDTAGAIFTTTSTSSPTGTSTELPTIGSHTYKKKPVGAIAGGVVGGIAVIAFVAFLIFWFCLRKRTKAKAAAQADAAQAALMLQRQREEGAATQQAYNGYNQVSEIGGNPKPMAAYTPASPPGGAVYAEKPLSGNGNQSAYAANAYLGNQSPPPMSSNSQQQYSELGQDEGTRTSTLPPSSLYTQSQLSPPIGASELGTGDHRGSYQTVPSQDVTELGGDSRVPPQVQEMSGASTGGLERRPQGPVRYDMAGNPLHDRFHELE